MKRLSERVSRVVHGGGFSEGRAVLRARHRGHLERASSLAVRAHDGRVRRLRVEEIREGFRPEFGSAEFTHLGGRLRRRRRRDGVGGFAREELTLHPVAVHLAPLLHARLERRRRPVTLTPSVVPRDVDGHLQLVVDVVVGGWGANAKRGALRVDERRFESHPDVEFLRQRVRLRDGSYRAFQRLLERGRERVHPRGVPQGVGFAIDDAAPRGVHVRRHGVFRVAELLVPRARRPRSSPLSHLAVHRGGTHDVSRAIGETKRPERLLVVDRRGRERGDHHRARVPSQRFAKEQRQSTVAVRYHPRAGFAPVAIGERGDAVAQRAERLVDGRAFLESRAGGARRVRTLASREIHQRDATGNLRTVRFRPSHAELRHRVRA